ncbi:MAG: aldehyde dehydrogenase [Verrucomicrobia bacterium]|nr:MAG: aldehyde dehydrogenase [Verrucomicrobiota bacterium]
MKDHNAVIKDLVETLRDGQEGFKQAAQGVKNPELKSLFNTYSQQRERFASELLGEAMGQGKLDAKADSSTAGALHRAWIGLKAAVTNGDDHAILAECERGEDSAVAEYKKVVDDDLSGPLFQIITRQYMEIRRAHDRIKDLRETTK